jgi:hypothetical protein
MEWNDVAQDSDQWGGSCERSNEPAGSIKYWRVLEQLNNWPFFKQGSVP